jgi:hypothetical protein
MRACQVAVIGLCCTLGACANAPENLVFVTATSVGLNVDTVAPSASFAHDRMEGYFAPRYAGKNAPAVYASFATNGQLVERSIKQLFATGEAAKLVSGVNLEKPQEKMLKTLFQKTALREPDGAANEVDPDGFRDGEKVMFFGTGTTAGIKIGFSPTAFNTFVLGFKRKEMSVIPAGKTADSFPSVIASVDSNTSANTVAGSRVDLKQFFATGAAAEALAKDLRSAFRDNAKDMLSYRENERTQSAVTLDSLECFAALQDDKLPAVWDNADQLHIFTNNGAAIHEALKTASAHDARSLYTSKLIQIDPDSPTYTGRLEEHAVRVCKLAGR